MGLSILEKMCSNNWEQGRDDRLKMESDSNSGAQWQGKRQCEETEVQAMLFIRRNKVSALGVAEHQNRLHREVVESLPLAIFKTKKHPVLGSLP